MIIRFLFISLVILNYLSIPARGQGEDLFFRGDFRDVLFLDFAEDIEKQTGVTFCFIEEWTRGIRVTASGEKISLKKTLDRTLLPADLFYHIEGKRYIYITNQHPLVSTLPDYSGSTIAGELQDQKKAEGPISSEQKYIDGRKVVKLETIHVGSRNTKGGRNVAVLYGKITEVETLEPLVGPPSILKS